MLLSPITVPRPLRETFWGELQAFDTGLWCGQLGGRKKAKPEDAVLCSAIGIRTAVVPLC